MTTVNADSVVPSRVQNAAHLVLPFPRPGVPGMGRVIIHEGTETARLWRRHFPTPAPLGGRFVAQPFERFLTYADRALAAGGIDLTPRAFP
jgi:hypothetical protein